jgi:hypothetical protein
MMIEDLSLVFTIFAIIFAIKKLLFPAISAIKKLLFLAIFAIKKLFFKVDERLEQLYKEERILIREQSSNRFNSARCFYEKRHIESHNTALTEDNFNFKQILNGSRPYFGNHYEVKELFRKSENQLKVNKIKLERISKEFKELEEVLNLSRTKLKLKQIEIKELKESLLNQKD